MFSKMGCDNFGCMEFDEEMISGVFCFGSDEV
jgi:hypothetical protein